MPVLCGLDRMEKEADCVLTRLREELSVPKKEGVDGPDFPGVVHLAVVVGVQKLEKLLGVEKLLGHSAGKGLFDDPIIGLLAEPNPDGNRETQVLLLSGFLWDIPLSGFPQGRLGISLCDPMTAGNGTGHPGYLLVQERNPKLQGMGHAHAVSF